MVSEAEVAARTTLRTHEKACHLQGAVNYSLLPPQEVIKKKKMSPKKGIVEVWPKTQHRTCWLDVTVRSSLLITVQPQCTVPVWEARGPSRWSDILCSGQDQSPRWSILGEKQCSPKWVSSAHQLLPGPRLTDWRPDSPTSIKLLPLKPSLF